MATDEWAEVDDMADLARGQASKLIDAAKYPEDPLALVAYWAEVEAEAATRKWDAVGVARDAGHQWWKIGAAVRMAGEALRQMYQRHTK